MQFYSLEMYICRLVFSGYTIPKREIIFYHRQNPVNSQEDMTIYLLALPYRTHLQPTANTLHTPLDILGLSVLQSAIYCHPLNHLKILVSSFYRFYLFRRWIFPRLFYFFYVTLILMTLSGDLWDKSTMVSTCTPN